MKKTGKCVSSKAFVFKWTDTVLHTIAVKNGHGQGLQRKKLKQLWFQYPTGSVNAIKFLNILPLSKDHSKQVWITMRINISLDLIGKNQIIYICPQNIGMKRILSTAYSDGLFNLGTFLLRACLGILMFVNHGLPKIFHFSEFEKGFYNFLHLGSNVSLGLSIIAEVFASAFLVLGLFPE
jgi:hypothetical protein